jgi:hypothetical protein
MPNMELEIDDPKYLIRAGDRVSFRLNKHMQYDDDEIWGTVLRVPQFPGDGWYISDKDGRSVYVHEYKYVKLISRMPE